MISPDPLAAQIPSAWAVYLPLIAALARTLLAAAGGVGFTWALTVNADQVQMAVSAAMAVAAAVWSLVQKVQATRALRIAAANPPGVTAPKLPA